MKRLFAKALTAVLLGSALFISCESNNVVKSGQIKSKAEMSSGEKVANYFLGTGKFIECDETKIYTTTVFGGLKQQDASIMVNKKYKTAGFGSPYMAAYYVTQFDDNSRHVFTEAVENYLEDFENKALNRKSTDSFKKYGKGNVRLNWGTIKATTPNSGKGFCHFGYKFKEKSPYFTITVYPVENEMRIQDEIGEPNSIMLTYWLTKAQARDLVSMLSDDIVYGALNEYEAAMKNDKVLTGDSDVDADSYGDGDQY